MPSCFEAMLLGMWSGKWQKLICTGLSAMFLSPWRYGNFVKDNFLLYIEGDILCILGYSAASLASTYWMPLNPLLPTLWQSKISADIAKCPLGSENPPLAENHCIIATHPLEWCFFFSWLGPMDSQSCWASQERGADDAKQMIKKRKVLKLMFPFHCKEVCLHFGGTRGDKCAGQPPAWAPWMECCQCQLCFHSKWPSQCQGPRVSPFRQKTGYLNSLSLKAWIVGRDKCELEGFVNVADGNPGISC